MVNLSKILIASAALVSVSAAPISRREAKPFTKSNGEAAIALNQKFQTLKAGAACSASDGVQCAKDSLAQCVGGKIVVSACAGGTVCRALPLVNKAGTSVSCDTEADATKRIADTGATKAGKLSESSASTAADSTKETSKEETTNTEEDSAATSEEATTSVKATASAKATAADKATTQAAAGGKPFTKANGEAAIALNEKFQKVKAGAVCAAADGVQCSKDALAQCVNGKIVVSACASGTVCRALPLVNSAGTSVTCDTAADADKRIADTGATKAAKASESSASGSASASAAASSAESSATASPASENAKTTDNDKATETAKTGVASDAKPFTLANGKAAIELNNKFKDIKAGQKCTFTEPQCAGDKLANCLAGKVVTQSCGTGTVCRALPLVNKAGTSVTCDTAADADARITATGASSDASTSTSDSQDTKKSDDKESSEVDASSQEDKSEDNTDKENIDLSGSEDKEVSEDDSEETAAEDTSAEETDTDNEDTTEEDDSETASEETTAEETTEEDSTSTDAKAEVSATPVAPAGAAKPFTLSNGQDAIALNKKFQAVKEGSACTSTEVQCAGDKLANCIAGKIVVSACAGGTVCRALPLVNKAGTSVTCDTAADALARIAATGAKA